LELGVEVIGIEPRKTELRHAIVKWERRHAPSQIVMHTRDASSVVGDMFGHNFRHATNQSLLGSVDGHALMDAAKRSFGIKDDMIPDARRVSANEPL
jgi:hypothetical protein